MPDSAAGAQGAAASATPTTVAADLHVATRTDEDPAPYLRRLASVDHAALERVRTDRDVAVAFWTNLYNAGTQLLLERHPGRYKSPLRFLRFFRTPAVTVAGQGFSLDAIEHGILRGGRSKYGLGYLPRFPRRFERRYCVDCDPRLHFALNCGAESCPAIRAYEPARVDGQLDLATRSYLDASVAYDPDAGVAHVPRLFLWYRGDFDGGDGIRAMLREYDAIPAGADPSLRYRPWDWSKAAGEFA